MDVLLADAVSVKLETSIGHIVSDASSLGAHQKIRPSALTADFPALYLRSHGLSRFREGRIKGAVSCDGPILDASLIFQLSKRCDPHWCDALVEAFKADTNVKFIGGDVFVASNEGSGTYGHWFGHTLPCVIEFLRAFPEGKVIVPASYFGVSNKNFGELALAAGLSRECFITAREGEVFEVENLVTCDLMWKDGVFHPKALAALSSLRSARSIQTAGCYLKRVNPSKRAVANCSALESTNSKFGIPELVLGSASISVQRACWTETDLLIGVLGSDFTNMLFSSAGRVLVISPEKFGDTFFFGLAAALGYQWNELVCTNLVTERVPIHTSDFMIDANLYEEMLVNLLGTQ